MENVNEGQEFDTTNGLPTPIKAFPWGSPTIGKIAGALAKAQGMIQNPGKTSKVQAGQYSYKYAPLNEVQDAARAALAENEIAVFQPVCGDSSKIEITTVLMHSSGEWFATDPLVCPMSSAGNRGSVVQSMGGLITYLRRYSLSAALNISSAEEDTDGRTEDEPTRLPPVGRQDRGQPNSANGNGGAKTSEPAKPVTPPPPANPPKHPDKSATPPPATPATPAADGSLDEAKLQFRDALNSDAWKKNGINVKSLEGHVVRLHNAKALSAGHPNDFTPDDYYLVMAAMDFEIAKKEWLGKGMPLDGVQQTATALMEANELSTDKLDALTEKDYGVLMSAIDADLGIGKE